jgi:hypothetical protein
MIDFLYKAQYDVGCGVGGGSTERVKDESLQSALATATNAGDDPQSAQEAEAPLIVHAKLYIFGDKYDIPSLKKLACRNYGEIVATQWNTKAFPESAEIIYNNIAVERDVLKDVIYENARNNILTLINVPGFEGLLRRANDFAADILISLIQKEKQEAGNIIICHTCGSYGSRTSPTLAPPQISGLRSPPPPVYGYRPARSSQGLGIPTIWR